MIPWLVRRILLRILLVAGIATLLFAVVNLAPGDPASLVVAPGVRGEVLEQVRANFGLDRPIHVRYVRWVAGLARGDLGWSYSHRRPVADVVGAALPNTLLLSATALVAAFLLGIAIGVVQAVRHRRFADSFLSVVTLFFYSMPSFWLGLMLILVFSLQARNAWEWPLWFPASGTRSVDWAALGPMERLADRAWHLALPAATLTLVLAAGVARYVRGSMLEVIRQDFVRTARAKGLPESRVILVHALRNALGPVVTLLGLYLPVLFSGTVFVETVFAWPGMGKTMVDAIATRDYPVVMAAGFLFAVLVVAGNLLADVLYGVVDPRVRHGGAGS